MQNKTIIAYREPQGNEPGLTFFNLQVEQDKDWLILQDNTIEFKTTLSARLPTIKELTFQFTSNHTGKSLVVYKNSSCNTVYETNQFQVFYTDIFHVVYNKHNGMMYELPNESWNKMVNSLDWNN